MTNISLNLESKLIVIDGVEYSLVKKENVDKRTKVIVSMETPFGVLQSVLDRDGFALDEGEYEFHGHTFHVEYASEDDVDEKVGTPIELSPVDMLLLRLLRDLDSDE